MEALILIITVICFVFSAIWVFGNVTGHFLIVILWRIIALLGTFLPIIYWLKIAQVI